jgi:nucleotide-binding universal stress UspA family protein
MKRILVPLDGSPLAEAILPVVEEWAKTEGAEVILLRAVMARHLPFADAVEAEVRVVREAETYLEAVAERLERRGITKVRRVAWYDEPATAIGEAAARDRVDLIAMATHGRSGLNRLLLGSVAEAVVRSVRVPMLLLRGQSAWKPWLHKRILVPLDGSEASEAILPMVERLARPRALTVTLLEVVEPLSSPEDSELASHTEEFIRFRLEEGERYLAKVADPLRAKGLRVECIVRIGGAAGTITIVAAEEQADLIAMVTHGRKGLERLFFGSVAAGVLRNATVPVLLFKAREREG